jgi:RES domain-containing protein
MRLDDVLARSKPWHGHGFLHVPAHVDPDGVTVGDLVSDSEGRWNRGGQPTLYLACDPAVAVSEFVRHLDVAPDAPPEDDRSLVCVALALPQVVDLRDPDVASAFGIVAAPTAFLDETVSRRVSAAIRERIPFGGVLTPPMAFLDQPERWNLVVFADDAGQLEASAQSPMPWGRLGLGAR